jgi:hypothetical protein
MGSFPFFGFPYPGYYRNYPHYYNKFQNEFSKQSNVSNKEISEVEKNADANIMDKKQNFQEHKKISSRYNSIVNFNLSNLLSSSIEEPILEIFGIELYLDDIIIICLLFFLYKEGVKDELLFIALILLLLS